MAKTGREKRLAVAASAMLASLALTGCGYDVQFNGAIFEAMGLANNGGPREEPSSRHEQASFFRRTPNGCQSLVRPKPRCRRRARLGPRIRRSAGWQLPKSSIASIRNSARRRYGKLAREGSLTRRLPARKDLATRRFAEPHRQGHNDAEIAHATAALAMAAILICVGTRPPRILGGWRVSPG